MTAERTRRKGRPPGKGRSGASFLADPEGDPELGPNIRARFDLPAREARLMPPPGSLHTELLAALERTGLGRLYSHQAEGLKLLAEGRDLLLCTPTASGKSLVYQIYALDAWLKDPAARSLFVYPFKALAQDQRGKMNALAESLGFPEFRAEIYDGDTPDSMRKKLANKPPPVLLTNPDMLHLAFLGYAENWREYFRGLRLLVLDEAHVYRGIFGAHVHHLLWRLGRLTGAQPDGPRWVATSATLSNGGGFFKTLTGREASVIDETGAPQPERRLFLLSGSGSPYTLACELMDRLLREEARTLAFTKARKVTELVYSWLCARDRAYRKTVSSYRAGFLPSERRRIEQGFFEGSLQGVVSTSAMEVGIDVGGLDACILVGYPGSLISLFQRMGRVGRRGREADVFLVAMPDALDQYFVQHPERLLGRPVEEIVLDPDNPILLRSHLLCAAREEPLLDSEAGETALRRSAVETLDRSGDLVLDAEGVRWHSLRRRPHRDMSLRGLGEGYRIVDGAGKAIGTIDPYRVYRECHEGAVYLHQGQSYEVRSLSEKDRKVVVEAVSADYYTEVRSEKETEILEISSRRTAGPYELLLGRVRVTERVTGYAKRRIFGGETMGEYPLQAPPQSFETEGFWVALPAGLAGLLASRGLHVMGGIHAFEHALIGIFPLAALADRWDLGGISFPHHPQVGGPAVFIYDGYPGGIGLSAKGYERFETLLEHTSRLVRDCPCETGCPGCIQSPKCGNGNRPLDKAATVLLMDVLEGRVEAGHAAQDVPTPAQPAEEAPPLPRERPGRLVFDLETQRLAADVGGWHRIRDMRLSLACAWDLDRDSWRTYFEEEAEDLIGDLLAADLVIGFNVIRFDLEVLRPYTPKDLGAIRVLDLLDILKGRLGFRVSLASLAESNFSEGKEADGVDAVRFFREGRFDLLESYCRKDVELTGRLYKRGLEEGYVLLRDKGGTLLRVNVNRWEPVSSRPGRSR